MLDELKEILKNKHFDSEEELQKFIQEYMQKQNLKPLEDFGGLTPEQMTKLLYTPVYSGSSPLQLNINLPADDLAGSIFYTEARKVLELILESPPKLTATGNLTREFVSKYMAVTGFDTKIIREYNKVINEEDFFDLHIIRVVLDLAGLIRKRSKHFIASSDGKKMLQGDPGMLYRALFYTFFCKMNLAYLDRRFPEYKEIQDTINFSIFIASTHCYDWIKASDFTKKVLYDGMRLDQKYHEELSKPYWGDHLLYAHYHRFIYPMVEFGLFQEEETKCSGS